MSEPSEDKQASDVGGPKNPSEKGPSNVQSPSVKSPAQNGSGGPSPLQSPPRSTKSPFEEMVDDLLETSCAAAFEELKIASPGIASPPHALTVSGTLSEAHEKGLQCPSQIKEVASPTYLDEKKSKEKLIEELSDLTAIEEVTPVQDYVKDEDIDLLVYGMRGRKRTKQGTFCLRDNQRNFEGETSGKTTPLEQPTKHCPPSSEEVLDDIGFTYDATSFASLQISIPGDHRPPSKRVRRKSRKGRRSRVSRTSRSSSAESLEDFVVETTRKNILRDPLCDCVGLPRPAGIQQPVFHPDISLVGEVEEEDVSVLCYMLNDLVQYLEAGKMAGRKDAETQHEEIPLIQLSSSSTTDFEDPIYLHKSTCWHGPPGPRMVSECIQTDFSWMESSSSFAEFATTKKSATRVRTVLDDAGPLEGSSVEELTQIFSGSRKQEELSRADVKGMVNDRTFKGELSSVDGVPLVTRLDS